jgi:cytosine/adenosine deaminase-related metal-dependent hydrolase
MSLSLGSKQVLLFSSEHGWHLRPALIHIKDSLITRVDLDPNQEQIAAASHWFNDDLITPGFVDSHTHLALNFMRGRISAFGTSENLVEDVFFRLEELLTVDDVRAFTRMGAYECLLSGTTFAWDHYYHPYAIADAMMDVGLTGTVAGTLQDLAGPGRNDWQKTLECAQRLSQSTRHFNAGIFSALGPHATDTVSIPLWQSVAAVASSLNLPIHCHVAQSPDEFLRISGQYGCTPVEFLKRQGICDIPVTKNFVHMIYVSKDDLASCQSDDLRLIACPHSQLIFHYPAAFLDWWTHTLNWGVGTDCAASNDTLRVQSEMRTLATWPMTVVSHSFEFQHFRETPSPENAKKADALRLQRMKDQRITISREQLLNVMFFDSARGLSNECHTRGLTAGGLANLVIWNSEDPVFWPGFDPLHSLAFGDLLPAMKGLMTIGQWRGTIGNVRGSIVASPEYREARHEATRCLNHLLRRAGL